MDPKEMAFSFEAVKMIWRQDKNGYVLSLSIHPNDVPKDLADSWIGTKFRVAMVELADDGSTPVAGKDTASGAKAMAAAILLCKDERFWQWIASFGDLVDSEEEAAEWMREKLNISSRSEIKTNQQARQDFFDLRDSFIKDYRAGK